MRCYVLLTLASLAAAGDLPNGPGREIVLKACDTCHRVGDIAEYKHTKEEWMAAVERMVRRGARVTPPESDVLIDYLAANFPKIEDPNKVNVNKAPAKDLETRLDLTAQEADAIVKYRERNPEFRVWGDLLVVYGVDGRKIQAAKDKMSF